MRQRKDGDNMRPIDADANIETMKKCAANPESKQALLCYRFTQRILEEAPTVEPASPWRRVEEPPKVSCKVIAYAVSNSTGERDVTTAYYKQRSSRFHITGRRSHWRVTHWMPIEPPREDA